MRRAVIIANKWWEADPLVEVLSSASSAPATIRFARDSEILGRRGYVEMPRGRIEIWCIQELMSPSKSGSNTEEKARVLEPLLSSPDIVFVVAFGTAATPTDQSLNGSVIVGTKTFCHDPQAKDTQSHWVPPAPDTIVDSSLDPRLFAALTADPLAKEVDARLLPVPINPDKNPGYAAHYDYVALADVNVTNYADYSWADPQVVQAFHKLGSPYPIGSLETTHAVIRAYARAPFMFASGITDRVGHFDDEVTPAAYGQNFVAAHNAALAIAFMIPLLASNVLVSA